MSERAALEARLYSQLTVVADLKQKQLAAWLTNLAKQSLFNMQGEPVTTAQFIQQTEAVWEYLPATNRVLPGSLGY